MKYRLDVDEVGNPDLKSSDHEDNRQLCLTRVIFELKYVDDVLLPEIEKLKKDFFCSHPEDQIIFHRMELLHKKPSDYLVKMTFQYSIYAYKDK